uniref:CSON009472 protein n=2 Tax=Culicoides sonorensis TaxID=179676 RepID=A0A336MYB0_CULSO
MSTLNSPAVTDTSDTSVYNSALDTTLNKTDPENSSVIDLSSFKSDLDTSGSTINDDILASDNSSVSDNLLQSLSGSKTTNQGQVENVYDVSVSSNSSKNSKKVNRSLFNDTEQAHDYEQQGDIESEQDKIKIYSNIEEFEKNLPETVTMLTSDCGSKVYLVGTAHFSEKSKNDVSFVIRNVQPDVVMVELCPSRVHILRHDEKTLLEEAKDINLTKIRNIINTNGLINGVFYILLLNMSAKITKELGMAPGGEFRRAVNEVNQLDHCMVHLGDRPIAITLKRALHGLSLFQTLKLVWKLITFDEEITTEEVEQCKQKDLLEELMKEMAGEFPAFGDVFVKERDLFLCHSLQVAALPQHGRPTKVVGIVGIGHAEGISKNWGTVDQKQIQEILTIPPASLSNRIFKITIKYGTLSLIGYGLFKLIKPRLYLLGLNLKKISNEE